MAAIPETTLQQLARIHRERQSLEGVLRYRLDPSPEKRIIPLGSASDPGGIRHCSQLLLQYASEEHRLRLRLRRKQAALPVSQWQLRATLADGKTALFELADVITLAGRSPGCDLQLPLPFVSRQHVTLIAQPDGIRLRDLYSTNGTRVNGAPVQQAMLHAGDTLTLAGLDFVVEYCGPTEGVFFA